MKWVAAFLSGTAAASSEHPIEKVITLLKGLAVKAEGEGKNEAVAFNKFVYWCKNSEKELNKAIAEENDTIDALSNKIDAKTTEDKALTGQIAKLTEEIKKMDNAAKKAKDLRDKANKLYTESKTDMKATIKAVEECIKALKDSDGGALVQEQVRGVLALVQTSVTQEQQQTLEQFTEPVDVAAMGDRGKHVKKYSFKSGNVIELLKQLLLKFEDDLVETEKEETNSVNAYELEDKARDNAKKAAEGSKKEKGTIQGEVQKELAQAKGDLKDQKDQLEADTKTLDSTTKSCGVKKTEWAERSEIRTNEIAAIEMAVKILAKVGGVRTEAPGNPVPPASPVDFLQTVADSSDPKMKAVVYLRQQAQVLHASALERLAQQVAAHLGDPFGEVTNMIEKMIFRLMAEQKDEDDHKNWCDQELEKTDTSINDKKDKVESLTSKLEEDKATVQELTEEIKDATEMVAKIVSFMNEATDIRKIGKQENALAIKDSEDAQTAVANAIAVLTDFYKSSGEIAKEPYEFIQGVKLGDKPDTWDSSYSGVSDPDKQPGGIITILEETNTNFAKMEADTRANEAADQKTFDDDMQEHGIEKAKRSKEAEMKTNEKKRLIDGINGLTKTKKHVSDELEATEQYMSDLKPACGELDKDGKNDHTKYEERKAARAKEIEALHKAQDILAEAFKEGSAFLQRKPIRRA